MAARVRRCAGGARGGLGIKVGNMVLPCWSESGAAASQASSFPSASAHERASPNATRQPEETAMVAPCGPRADVRRADVRGADVRGE